MKFLKYAACVTFPLLVGLGSLSPVYAESRFQWEIINRVLTGTNPSITLYPNRTIEAGKLTLKRNDGKSQVYFFSEIRNGEKQTIMLDGEQGRWHYEGNLSAQYPNKVIDKIPVSFDVIVAQPMGMKASHERMRLEEGHLEVQLTRNADRCTYEVFIEEKPAITGEVSFLSAPAGTWLEVNWNPYTEEDVVLKLVVECYDTDGFSNGLELFPWKIEVPHDDINFLSGKSRIEESEYPKLLESVNQITTTVRRYSEILDVSLFVSGHTDSVGDRAYNENLSQKRAQAIAQQFRRHGVRIPIYFVGYGEDKQAISTEDNVEESRNRRSRYILAVQPPEKAKWKKL